MTPLWSSESAESAAGGVARASWQATGVSIDTRTLAPGDLFVALRGPNHDGHDFAAEALERGAAAVMVERRAAGIPPGAPALEVDCTARALEALGHAARSRARTVVGITGSVGKTGTRSMLEAALRPSGSTIASERSLNNHIGVPLTLSRIPDGTRFAVIEMGMSGFGEIRDLSRLARPDIAVITAIAPAHLAALGSLERIAEAKAEIFEFIADGGTAIIPDACAGQDLLAGAAARSGASRIWTFGESSAADARLLRSAVRNGATAVSARILGEDCAYRLGAPGRHWARNSLSVQLVLRAAGANCGRAVCSLAEWCVPAGRGAAEWIGSANRPSHGFTLIDDSYNANPVSMAAALERLAEEPIHSGSSGLGRRVAFLGDMLELGQDEYQLHAGLASLAAFKMLDAVHLCGPRMRALHEGLPPAIRGGWEADADRLAVNAPRLVRPGDVVMVKGSNGARTGVIAAALRNLDWKDK